MMDLEKTFNSLLESIRKQQENFLKKEEEIQAITAQLEEIDNQLNLLEALQNQLLMERSNLRDQLNNLQK